MPVHVVGVAVILVVDPKEARLEGHRKRRARPGRSSEPGKLAGRVEVVVYLVAVGGPQSPTPAGEGELPPMLAVTDHAAEVVGAATLEALEQRDRGDDLDRPFGR